MANNNSNLHRAKDAKKDEFYTLLSDIENELQHYKEHFKGKTVLCNCDDPYESNFFKYFILNFNYLGLKKLITTCYSTSPVSGTQISLFDEPTPNNSKHPYKVEITEVKDLTGNGAIDLDDIQLLLKTPGIVQVLDGDGDFKSAECIELLKEADIVVTNPPFSLFREYIAQLFEYNKSFIIIGNQNAITYKEVFPLLRDNKMWLGSQKGCISLYFEVPDDYEVPDNAKKVCISHLGEEYCNKHNMTYMRTCCWFTNLDHSKRHEQLELFKRYKKHEAEYPHYENYDAINVDKTSEIPYDYEGIMGVPITFLYQHCPDQFEIVELSRYLKHEGMSKEFVDTYYKQGGTGQISEGHPDLCYYSADGTAVVPYMRVLIRRKE